MKTIIKDETMNTIDLTKFQEKKKEEPESTNKPFDAKKFKEKKPRKKRESHPALSLSRGLWGGLTIILNIAFCKKYEIQNYQTVNFLYNETDKEIALKFFKDKKGKSNILNTKGGSLSSTTEKFGVQISIGRQAKKCGLDILLRGQSVKTSLCELQHDSEGNVYLIAKLPRI